MNTLDLITYDELPEVLRAVLSKRTLLRLGGKGAFPPAARLSHRAPPMWRRADIDRYLANKLASLEVQP